MKYRRIKLKLQYPVSSFLEITSNCNLKCKHCYNNSCNKNIQEIDYKKICEIIDELKQNGVYSVTISGGEPTIHRDFEKVIEYLACSNLNICLNTNGIFITEKICQKLHGLGIKDIQISVDGLEKTHDIIRGSGNFKKTFNSIMNAIKFGLNVRIGYTVNALNYLELDSFFEKISSIDIKSIAVYRFVPTSHRNINFELDLKKEQLSHISNNLINLRRKYSNSHFNIYFEDLSFFTFLHDASLLERTHCLAGIGQITISYTGDVLMCPHLRRPSINGKSISLKESWDRCNKNRLLLNYIPKECRRCEYSEICKGGCKSFSLAYYGDLIHKDPGCFK